MWLMGWPAGLKLNSSLDKFLGEMYLWLIGVWSTGFFHGTAAVGLMLTAMAPMGVFGLSSLLFAGIDVLRLATVHVRLFYFLSCRLYGWQFRILTSLFHLFRGRKWNVLRERLDSADYDLDQLLLGTILFSGLVFLFPTVIVYYLLFLCSMLYWMGIELMLKLVVLALIETPWFELTLWMNNSKMQTAGLQIDIIAGHVVVTTQPRLLISVMEPLIDAIKNTVLKLVNFSNLKCIFTGKPVTQ
jgi:phosphatidylinositol glycan class Q protein